MKKILHLIFGRFFVVAMAIILQVLWLCVVLWQLSYKFTYVNLLVRVIAIIVVLVIVNKWTNPANKLSWTFLILLSPIFGLMVYFLFGRSGLTKHTRERMDAVNRQVEALFQRDSAVEKGLEKESGQHICSHLILINGRDFHYIRTRRQNITAAGKKCSRIC